MRSMLRKCAAAALAAGSVALLPACGLAEPSLDPGLGSGYTPSEEFAPDDPPADDATGPNPVDPDRNDYLRYSTPCTDGSLSCTLKNSG